MRSLACCLLVLPFLSAIARAQSPDDITQLVNRVIELDSIDVAKEVKFRAGLEPALYTLEADESQMSVLKDPYEVKGQGQPAAAGWYRVSFVVPDRLGKFPMPTKEYNCGVESNCLGTWEIYTYVNGKPAGLWSKDGMQMAANRHPTYWMSTAPMPLKAGDKVTVAILAMASPLGRGSSEGYALRHLRLRFAYSHTAGRQPFLGSVNAPGYGNGLWGVRERLATLKGEELQAFQEKLKQPLANVDAVFKAAESEKLEDLTKALLAASKEIEATLKK